MQEVKPESFTMSIESNHGLVIELMKLYLWPETSSLKKLFMKNAQ